MNEFCRLKILGNGAGMVEKQFNTCFALLDENNNCFLVDAGGGQEILRKLKDSNTSIKQIKGLFISHNHIDHILGVLWIMRAITETPDDGEKCNFYMPDTVKENLITLIKTTMGPFEAKVMQRINFNTVEHMEAFNIGDNKFTAFETFERQTKNFGFKLETNNFSLGFCSDVPLVEKNQQLMKSIDILLHEALCDSLTADEHQVYERCHSTAQDAAEIAKKLKAKKLILIHKSDKFINNDSLYNDAKKIFTGEIIVPEENDTVILKN